MTRLVLDVRMCKRGCWFWMDPNLHHFRQIQATDVIRRGVDRFLSQPSPGACRFETPSDHVAAEPGDRCSLRLVEWPLRMKTWLGFFLACCRPIGEVEA
jgi:hypothetical protein